MAKHSRTWQSAGLHGGKTREMAVGWVSTVIFEITTQVAQGKYANAEVEQLTGFLVAIVMFFGEEEAMAIGNEAAQRNGFTSVEEIRLWPRVKVAKPGS